MDSGHTANVYKVTAELFIGSGEADSSGEDKSTYITVNTFKIVYGMNMIPRVQAVVSLVCDTRKSIDGTVVMKSDDFTTEGGSNSTFNILSKAKTDDEACSFRLSIDKIDESDGPGSMVFTLKDWVVADVGIEPQNMVSPGLVIVTLAHPMWRLLESPGFFCIDSETFSKTLHDTVDDANDVVEVADKVLAAIEAAMNSEDYKTSHVSLREGFYFSVKGAGRRLSEYIDVDQSLSGKWPYVHLFDGTKLAPQAVLACKMVLARYFLNLQQNTPFDALVRFCQDAGCYIKVGLLDEKAKLCLLNPWGKRKKSLVVEPNTLASVGVGQDRTPIAGVRMRGMAVSSASPVVTTLSSNAPVSETRDIVHGDTLYMYTDAGAIVNLGIPEFTSKIVSQALTLKNSGISSGDSSNVSTTNSKKVIVDMTAFTKDIYTNIKEFVGGDEDETDSLVAAIFDTTARTQFALLYRRTTALELQLPAMVLQAGPEIGSIVQVGTGTGGATVTGIVSAVEISGSCTNGSVVKTIACGYSASKYVDFDSMPQNNIWNA